MYFLTTGPLPQRVSPFKIWTSTARFSFQRLFLDEAREVFSSTSGTVLAVKYRHASAPAGNYLLPPVLSAPPCYLEPPRQPRGPTSPTISHHPSTKGLTAGRRGVFSLFCLVSVWLLNILNITPSFLLGGEAENGTTVHS